MTASRKICVFGLLATASALSLPPPQEARAPRIARREAVFGASLAAASLLPRAAVADTTQSGLTYNVIKSGKGGQPATGDLIAIRFKGMIKSSGQVFDDIMESAEAYYFRVGSGSVLPGVEEAVKLMHTGDVWDLTIPGKLAFGDKGRSASPGKPRIPSNAEIGFLLELVAVPGKDDELLEVTGGGEAGA